MLDNSGLLFEIYMKNIFGSTDLYYSKIYADIRTPPIQILILSHMAKMIIRFPQQYEASRFDIMFVNNQLYE